MVQICYFCSLEGSNYQWMGGGAMEQKVLFRLNSHLLCSWFKSRMGDAGLV